MSTAKTRWLRGPWGQTARSVATVKVVLVPVGPVPPDLFKHYVSVIRAFADVPMRNLTPPADFSRHTALKFHAWTEGALHLEFITPR